MSEDFKDYLFKTYDKLHGMPEASMEEYDTCKFIKNELENFGYETIENVGSKTGVIGVLDSNKPGPVFGLRADMDALEFVDEYGRAYYCHACGHDGHSAMVLTAGKILAERGIKRGKLYLIFQPGEETLEGAKAIMESGYIDDLEELVGIHLMSEDDIPMGAASPALIHGSIYTLKVHLKGLNAHGARPHLGVNVIDTGCLLVNSLNALRFDPSISHSIKVTGFVAGGVTSNLIPDSCHMTIDLRCEDNKIMKEILISVKNAIDLCSKINGASYSIDYLEGAPAAKHDPELVGQVEEIITQVLGQSLGPKKTVGGEDFHSYSNDMGIKTAYIGLGCDLKPGLHHPKMTFNKEALAIGVEILKAISIEKLA